MNKSNKMKGPDIDHVLFESGKSIALTYAGDSGKAESAGQILMEGSAYADHIIMQLEKSGVISVNYNTRLTTIKISEIRN